MWLGRGPLRTQSGATNHILLFDFLYTDFAFVYSVNLSYFTGSSSAIYE